MPVRSQLRSDLQRARDTLRLEALSDGVIAIAITLLILEIRVPDVDDASPQEVWTALRALWPQYLGYLLSFATIGIFLGQPPSHLSLHRADEPLLDSGEPIPAVGHRDDSVSDGVDGGYVGASC